MIIYKVKNLVNGKIYIGQTNGRCKYYRGGGKLLSYAYKKYGRNKFVYGIIVEGDFSQKLTDELETHYIRLYNSTDSKVGYNIERGGWGSRVSIQTPEVKEKRRLSLIKAYSDPALRKRQSDTMKKHMTPEYRARISWHLSQRVISEETRKRLSECKKGIKPSQKVINALIANNRKRKGLQKSPETVVKIRLAAEKRRGIKLTPEHVWKLRESKHKYDIVVFKGSLEFKRYRTINDCAKDLHLSPNTVRPRLLSGEVYNELTFKKIFIKK